MPPSGPPSSPAKDLAYVLATLNARGAGILAATATQVCDVCVGGIACVLV